MLETIKSETGCQSYPKCKELILEGGECVYACQTICGLGYCRHAKVPDFLVVSKAGFDGSIAWISLLGSFNCLLELVWKGSSRFHCCVAAGTHVWSHLVDAVAHTSYSTSGPSLHLSLFYRYEGKYIPILPEVIESQLSSDVKICDLGSEGFGIGLRKSWDLAGFVCQFVSCMLPGAPLKIVAHVKDVTGIGELETISACTYY